MNAWKAFTRALDAMTTSQRAEVLERRAATIKAQGKVRTRQVLRARARAGYAAMFSATSYPAYTRVERRRMAFNAARRDWRLGVSV